MFEAKLQWYGFFQIFICLILFFLVLTRAVWVRQLRGKFYFHLWRTASSSRLENPELNSKPLKNSHPKCKIAIFPRMNIDLRMLLWDPVSKRNINPGPAGCNHLVTNWYFSYFSPTFINTKISTLSKVIILLPLNNARRKILPTCSCQSTPRSKRARFSSIYPPIVSKF